QDIAADDRLLIEKNLQQRRFTCPGWTGENGNLRLLEDIERKNLLVLSGLLIRVSLRRNAERASDQARPIDAGWGCGLEPRLDMRGDDVAGLIIAVKLSEELAFVVENSNHILEFFPTKVQSRTINRYSPGKWQFRDGRRQYLRAEQGMSLERSPFQGLDDDRPEAQGMICFIQINVAFAREL